MPLTEKDEKAYFEKEIKEVNVKYTISMRHLQMYYN